MKRNRYNWRRLLALVMCSGAILALFPGSAYAESNTGAVAQELSATQKTDSGSSENAIVTPEKIPADTYGSVGTIGDTYLAGYGSISSTILSTDDTDHKQESYSKYTVKVKNVYAIRDQKDYTSFTNLPVDYEFRIPAKLDGGGVLSFSSYAWLSNTTVTTVTENGKDYNVLKGQCIYTNAMPGATENNITVDVTNGINGETYDIEAAAWLDADGEATKVKAENHTVTIASSVDGIYDLAQYGLLSYSGYYNKTTNKYYTTEAEAAAAGDTGAKFGRFYWIRSYINPINTYGTSGMEGLSVTEAQTWKLNYSVQVTDGTAHTTTTETAADYVPYLIDTTDWIRDSHSTNNGFIHNKNLYNSGNRIDAYGGGGDSARGTYSGTDDTTKETVSISGTPIAGYTYYKFYVFGTTSLVFVPVNPNDGTNITRNLTWTVSDLSVTGLSGNKAGDSNLKNNTGNLLVPAKSNGGSIGKEISFGYQGNTAARCGIGDTVYVNSDISFTSTVSDAAFNAVNLFTKFDSNGFTLTRVDDLGRLSAYNSNYVGEEKQIKVLFAAKADGKGWTSNDEMLQTKASDADIVYYDTYAALTAAGKTCIGILNEYRNGLVTGTELGTYYKEFEATGQPGNEYIICNDYELWNGSTILSTKDTYSGTNGGTKPVLKAPTVKDYADLGNKTSYTVDDWSSGTGVRKDRNDQHTADCMRETGYKIDTSTGWNNTVSSSTGFLTTLLNGVDGPKDTTCASNPVTYNVSIDQRVAAVKSRFTIDWMGNSDDPEMDIALSFNRQDIAGSRGISSSSLTATWNKIHATGKTYIADKDAVVTWDDTNKVFVSNDASFKEIDPANFTVKGGGTRYLYFTYYLGDATDLSKDVLSTQYNLETRLDSLNISLCNGGGNSDYDSYPTVTIIRNGVIGLNKSSLAKVVAPGSDIGYELSSNSQASTYTGYGMLDVLPFDNDGRGSVIHGNYTLQDNGVTFKQSTADTAVVSDMKLYYTTDTKVRTAGTSGGLPTSAQISGSFDPSSSLGVVWKEMAASSTVDNTNTKTTTYSVQAGDESTAPAAIVVYGTFEKNEMYYLKLALKVNGNHSRDVYFNNATMSAPSFGNKDISSPKVETNVALKTINGTAWLDIDGNGVRNENEELLSGFTVHLYKADGTEVTKDAYTTAYGTVVTDTNGHYEFKDMMDNADGWYVTIDLGTDKTKYGLTTYHAKEATDTTDSDFRDGTSEGIVKSDPVMLKSYQEQAKDGEVEASATMDAGFEYKYTVKFNSDGGNYTPDDQHVLCNQKATDPKEPTKTGYQFNGWYLTDKKGNYLDKNGKVTTDTNSYVKYDFATPVIADTYLRAQWTIHTHRVTYYGNGNDLGTAPLDSANPYDYNEKVTVLGSGDLSKTGFTFLCWNTQADGQGTTYEADSTFNMPDADVDLYAQYTINSYQVIYDGNGNDLGTAPIDRANPYDYNEQVTVLGSGDLSKTGFTFLGWNTQADGKGTAYNKDSTFNMPAGNVVLYAQYTVNQYQVVYDGNGNDKGTAPNDNANPYDYDEKVTVLDNTNLSKTGYSFTGWNTAKDGSGTPYVKDSTFNMPNENVTLYAQYAPISYKVIYDGNGNDTGTAPIDGDEYQYQNTVTVMGNTDLVKMGHTFTGWNTKADGTGISYEKDSIFNMPAEDVTLYAQYKINNHKVMYDGNGNDQGTAPVDSKNPYDYNEKVTVLDNTSLSKTRYTFTGWNTKADGTGTSYTKDGTFNMPDADVTLYAQYAPIRYTVTFDSRGGSYTPDDQKVEYEKTAVKPADPTKTKNRFLGWYCEDKNGNLQLYDFGTPVTADIKLYASWLSTPITPDTPSQPTVEPKTIVPDTGDKTNIPLASATFGISVLMLGIVLFMKRKYSE